MWLWSGMYASNLWIELNFARSGHSASVARNCTVVVVHPGWISSDAVERSIAPMA